MFIGGITEPLKHGTAAHNAVAEVVTTLFLHCFLHAKPARVAQARWTGVASVVEWCLGLGLFHCMLGPLLGSLAAGWDHIETIGNGSNGPGPGNGNGDVAGSGSTSTDRVAPQAELADADVSVSIHT